jgi:hypothetical protein
MLMIYQAIAIQHELMKKDEPKIVHEPLFCFEEGSRCATFSRDVGRGNRTTNVSASKRILDQTLFAVKVTCCHNRLVTEFYVLFFLFVFFTFLVKITLVHAQREINFGNFGLTAKIFDLLRIVMKNCKLNACGNVSSFRHVKSITAFVYQFYETLGADCTDTFK